MTVGDRVTLLQQGPDESRSYDTQCPLMGAVRDQNDPDNPTSCSIIWETGPLVLNVPTAILLQVVTNDEKEGILIGKYLQITGLPLGSDFGTPKSPGASGICVQAFELADAFQNGTPQTAFVAVALDGTSRCILVPIGDPAAFSDPATIAELEAFGTISVQHGRRDVASS